MRVRGELARAARRRPPVLRGRVRRAGVDGVGDRAGPAAATALWQRTEGWAAGLQLAGLTLRGSPDPGAAAARVRGDDRHLFDYFTSEVLPALAPEQRDLLVRAAPLELLSGSLCDAALEVQGSAAVLAELERADLFVVALDAEREWYRCHRLLRDALLRGPRRPGCARDARRPAPGRALVRRARPDRRRRTPPAECRGRRGAPPTLLPTQRVRGSSSAAGRRRSWPSANGCRRRSVEPQLALTMAYAAKISGQPDRIVHWLDVCERRIDDDTVIDSWRSARAAALMMRGINGTPPDDPAQAVALCEQAVALEAAAGTEHNPVALAALGSAYGFDGRFEEAHGSWPTPGATQAGALVPRSGPAAGQSARPLPAPAGPGRRGRPPACRGGSGRDGRRA